MMRNTNLIGILISLVTVLAVSQDIFARERMFNPRLGRFMQRDPVGTHPEAPVQVQRNISDPKFTQSDPVNPQSKTLATKPPSKSQEKDLMADAYTSASLKMSQRLNNIVVSKNPHLLQYADGANLYQYVTSNPITGTDPSGLDRYIVDNGTFGGHTYILVDQWEWSDKKCCWVRLPWKQRYDFSADYNWGPFIILDVIYGPGLVRTERSLLPGGEIKEYTSMPWEDMQMENELVEQIHNPPGYSISMFNCWHWSYHNIKRGYGAPAPKDKKKHKICRE